MSLTLRVLTHIHTHCTGEQSLCVHFIFHIGIHIFIAALVSLVRTQIEFDERSDLHMFETQTHSQTHAHAVERDASIGC